MNAREDLTAIITEATCRWDEPLDEVYDIPQIVDAIIAAGYEKTVRFA